MDPLDVAEALFSAIEDGNVAAVGDLYAPGAVVWHNHDGVAQSAELNLRVLEWVVSHVDDLRYDEVRRERTEAGFVQQHVLRGTTRRGTPVSIPACMVVAVKEGLITRIDEYLDSAHVAALVNG